MDSVNDLIESESLRHQVALQKYGNGVVARLIAVLNRSDKRLFSELTERLESLSPSSFSIERLESLLTSVRLLNTEAFGQVERELTAELKDFVAYEASYQNQMLTEHVPVQVSVAAVNAEAVYAAALARPFQGVLLREVWKDLGAKKLRIVRQTIAQGFLESKTTDQIIRELRGTRAKGYSDALIEVTRRDAEAVVRTALGHMAGMVQDRSAEANRDIIKAVRWSATLDLRTSPTCFPASTLALPVGDLRGVSRRHWNGYLVVITTASGKKLRATPNHPVLTAGGWRPIQELQPGKDVLHVLGSDVAGVKAGKNVKVPASIGAVFDALSEPSFGDVFSEGSSEADFHGDGMRGDYEVNYPRSKGDLRLALNAAFGEQVAEQLLVYVGVPGSLPSERLSEQVVMGPELVDMSAQVNSGSVEDGVETGLADLGHPADLHRLYALDEHLDDLGFVRSSLRVSPAQCGHDARTLEDTSRSRGGDAVAASDRCSGFPVGVSTDDVVAVEREFFSGHVYNLSTSTAFYIADGFVVHNCRVRDGKLYEPSSHKPIGHSFPWLAGPGRAHWRCRSAQTVVLKSNKELGIDVPEVVVVGKTRASMDGQVPAEQTYADWLKKQSSARQDEVLGPTRARLLREGDLPLDRMYSQRGELLTLDQLKERDAAAFKRAGL